jgi:hypothetical protein
MLKVHGIDNANEGQEIKCKASEGFMVKNWHFGTPSGSSAHPYVNTGTSITPGGYSWSSADVTDSGGVPGQGRNNPKSFFFNHFIVQIGSDYYDPSYGVTHEKTEEMDGEMAGFYITPTYTTFLARENLSYDVDIPSTIDTKVSNTIDF